MLALHVHHGLSAHADAWLRHGEAQCGRWARAGLPVRFVSHRLAERPAGGESIEAWARRARYRALRAMAIAGGADLVLLAHHRRDQAETFLLQALRGGGVAALSSMPFTACRDGVTWARPWLAQPREAIEAYARRHRLRHVDDDTNGDTRFARNRLRATVWPALCQAFPEAEASLAQAATWAQQATAALDDQAAFDLRAVAAGATLDIAAWRSLSTARHGPALRAWLRPRLGQVAPATLVLRLLDELDAGASLRWPAPGGELRSYRGQLRYARLSPAETERRAQRIDLSRPGVHAIAAWSGSFVVEAVDSQGVALAVATGLELRDRLPGDRFQQGPGRPPRSLKLQYQAAGLPAWQRDGPLACHDGALVFVAGLGVDARAWAGDGEPQVRLTWRPD